MIAEIIVATIAAAPPTLVAVAGLRRAKQAALQVKPSNGVPLAKIVEEIASDIREIRRASGDDRRLLSDHITDRRAHR